MNFRKRLNKEAYKCYNRPKFLQEHIDKNDSIDIQVIGATGKGKSTVIAHLLERMKVHNPDLPQIADFDTTKEPTPYNQGYVGSYN